MSGGRRPGLFLRQRSRQTRRWCRRGPSTSPLPRVMAELAGSGHRVKTPQQFATPSIQAENVSAGTARRAVADHAAGNNHASPNSYRRGQGISTAEKLFGHERLEVEHSTLAEL